MTNPLKNLHKEAQLVRMTSAEKAAMHTRIAEAMRTNARPARPVKSTYVWYSWRMVGTFATLVVVVLGTGTTYAAEGALPGSPLYAVKVGVTEPIKGALAFSNEAKAEFHTGVAQARLEEAEALAAQGRLDNETSAALAARVMVHAEEVQTIAKKIEEEDPVTALEVTVQFDSSLAAHSEVLAHLGEKSKDEATRENSIVIAYSVAARGSMGGSGDASNIAMLKAPATADVEVSAFSATLATDTVGVGVGDVSVASASLEVAPAARITSYNSSVEERTVTQLEQKVEWRLDAVRAQFNTFKRKFSASTTAIVEARLDAIEAQMKAGKAAKENSDHLLARAEYNAALASIVELSTFLSASRKFNSGILDSLLRKYNFEVGEVRGTSHVQVEAVKGEPVEAEKKGEEERREEEVEKKKKEDRATSTDLKIEVQLGL